MSDRGASREGARQREAQELLWVAGLNLGTAASTHLMTGAPSTRVVPGAESSDSKSVIGCV